MAPTEERDATEVLTVHAETEGLAYRPLFQQLLARHRELGIETIPLRTLVNEVLAAGAETTAQEVTLGYVPGRAGRVAVVG